MIEGVSHPEPVGEGAIAVRIEGEAAAEVLSRVRAVATVIEAAAIAGVTDVVGSPGRVSVAYDPLAVEDLKDSTVNGTFASISSFGSSRTVG